MSIWGALAGGFAGTPGAHDRAAGCQRGSPHAHGPAVPPRHGRHRQPQAGQVLGYLAHFGFGFIFALVYYGLFTAIGRSGWALGGIFGLVHGAFSATALVNILLPVLHPRMGNACGVEELRRRPGGGQPLHGQVSDMERRHRGVGQGLQHGASDPALGVVVLGDDQAAACHPAGLHQGVAVDGLDRVGVDDARRDA